MLRPVALALVIVLMLGAPGLVGAQSADPDPAAFLPPQARIVQVFPGDVDGDGQPDVVVAYMESRGASEAREASALVLLARGDSFQPVHLFGALPDDLRGNRPCSRAAPSTCN
jgi:hypothetical protein